MMEVLLASFLVGLTGAVSPGPMSASILGMSHRRPLLSTLGLVAGHGIVEAAIIIGIISFLILIFTTIEMKFPQIGGKIPVANNIIIFSLINIVRTRSNDFYSRPLQRH